MSANLISAGTRVDFRKALTSFTLQQIRDIFAAGGLYGLANKADDRHVGKYKPARHHAQLAVNIAFTLCEFVRSSYHYQQQKQTKKATA
jgi:hypothetical protein